MSAAQAIAAVEVLASRTARAERLLSVVAAANAVHGDGEVFVRLPADVWAAICEAQHN